LEKDKETRKETLEGTQKEVRKVEDEETHDATQTTRRRRQEE